MFVIFLNWFHYYLNIDFMCVCVFRLPRMDPRSHATVFPGPGGRVRFGITVLGGRPDRTLREAKSCTQTECPTRRPGEPKRLEAGGPSVGALVAWTQVPYRP